MNKSAEKASFLDFLLSGTASAIACYAAGMGVFKPGLAYLLASMALVGSLLAYVLVSKLPNVNRSGATFYAVAVVSAVVFAKGLNSLLPDDGFPEILVIAASLSWMLVLGSLFAWSEGSLLFQAVPGIALFGMVGTWDTFKGAPFLFFAFLALSTAMLARTHNRSMIRIARSSGFSDLKRIRLGPWRGQAGPSWTLVLAFVVILASLLGAPVIQSTVEPVANAVAVSLPSTMLPRSSQRAQTGRADRISTTVGSGPVFLSKAEVMRIQLDRPDYLKTFAYEDFNGKTWTNRSPGSFLFEANAGNEFRSDAEALEWLTGMKNPVSLDYRFEVVGIASRYALPGFPTRLTPTMARTFGWNNNAPQAGRMAFRATSLMPNPHYELETAPRSFDGNRFPGVFRQIATRRVSDFARRAAQGGANDYDRALRVKQAIERQAKYNTNAEATPRDQDSVDYFLFESREGYCDLFASAMVAGARAIGLPARYAVGLYPANGERDDRGWFVLRENEFHAWAEVYFDKVGWIPFDPTEGAEVINADASDQRDRKPWYATATVRQILNVGIGLTVLVGLAGYFWLSRPQAKAAKPVAHIAARASRRYVRQLERHTGLVRMADQTLDEFATVTAPLAGSLAQESRDLAKTLARAFYSSKALSVEEAEALEARTAAFAQALRKEPKPKGAETGTVMRSARTLWKAIREGRKQR